MELYDEEPQPRPTVLTLHEPYYNTLDDLMNDEEDPPEFHLITRLTSSTITTLSSKGNILYQSRSGCEGFYTHVNFPLLHRIYYWPQIEHNIESVTGNHAL